MIGIWLLLAAALLVRSIAKAVAVLSRVDELLYVDDDLMDVADAVQDRRLRSVR